MPRGAGRQARTRRPVLQAALIGGGVGVASFAALSLVAHALFQRFPLDPNSPGSWMFGAAFVGIIAIAVVFVLGFAPGWSRRRDARRAAANSSQPAMNEWREGR